MDQSSLHGFSASTDEARASQALDKQIADKETQDTKDVHTLALEMQQRCSLLLGELEEFLSHLRQQKKERNVEVGKYKSGVLSEMRMINKLVAADPNDPKTDRSLKSLNYTFFSLLWASTKSCSGVTALQKWFYWIPGKTVCGIDGKVAVPGIAHRKHRAMVDIVAQNGLEWIKVSTATEKRIIWELTKAGWGADSSDEGEDAQMDDDDSDSSLLKQVEVLVKASRSIRVRYCRPKIHLVLPRISVTPDSQEVLKILQKIKNMGVTIRYFEQLPLETPPIHEVLTSLAADRLDSFSDTLNIDCTVLLAFASDLSHGRVAPEEWHNKDIARQIQLEVDDQLLPNSIWPACKGRKMVCTREAATRVKEIVDTIGTETEKRRAALLLNFDNDTTITPAQKFLEFQTLTDYALPSDWVVPVEIVDVDIAYMKSTLPKIADKVSETLTPINQSVFFYGWASGYTTISSNGSAAKDIEGTIEKNRIDDETRGPDVWLCPTARSLVGKEKKKRGHHATKCD